LRTAISTTRSTAPNASNHGVHVDDSDDWSPTPFTG